MSRAQTLRGFVSERLAAASREILTVVDRIVSEYEEEASGFRLEIDRQKKQLDVLLQAQATLKKAGLKRRRIIRTSEEDGYKDEEEEEDSAGTSSGGRFKRRKPGRSQISETQNHVDLRIRIIEDPQIDVLSNSSLTLQTADMSNNSSSDPGLYDCSSSSATFIITAYSLARLLLLVPLYTLVLYLGFQHWRQHRSFTTASHSDIFTYHVAALQFIWVLTFIFLVWVSSSGPPQMIVFSFFLMCFSWYVENFFHVLTCLERYLAVVHPITYMRLKNARGVRIRNISIVCVWFLSSVYSVVVSACYNPRFPIPFMIPFSVCLVAVTFCSFSVLYVLIRPGPGEGGQDRGRVDQSKKRAFVTITVIMLMLWLWFGGIIVFYAFYVMLIARNDVICVFVVISFWFSLPSGSVLPLLFLHRAGKLAICFHKNN